MTPDLLGFVRALSGARVDYIIVGGVAAGIHGALRTTLDLEIVYARDPANVGRLVAALDPSTRICVVHTKGSRSGSMPRPSFAA